MTPEELNTEDNRWHGDVLAIDPSVTSPGASLFRHGVLFACDRVRIPKTVAALPAGQRWLRVAQEIGAWWDDVRENAGYIRTVVFECPQIYTREKSKGDPNKLIGLAGVGQSVAVLITAGNIAQRVRPPEILTPLPAEWTGQLPKFTKGDVWKSPRAQRIASRLQPAERALVPAQHDAIDSLGLGLWALGRYERARVFPGAT